MKLRKNKLTAIIVGLVGFAGSAYAQGNLQINSGATLYTNGTSTITLQNSKVTNNGTITANNGTVLFTGSATTANSNINGNGTSAFKNITINKSSNGMQLKKNIAVAGSFNLSNGGVELVNANIDFGSTGSLQNETATNSVSGLVGMLSCTASLNAPSAANPANLGVEITSAANLGSTQINRSHGSFVVNGANSFLRSYNIVPTTNSGLNSTLRFYYFDTELNGVTESTMKVWQSNDNGTTWMQLTTSSSNTTANWIEVTGINSVGLFTMAAPCTPNTYYADADNDGYGDAATSQLACTQPTGYVTNNTDCDDAEVAIHSPIRYYLDNDGDGYGGTGSGLFCNIIAPTGYANVNGDCNNNDASVHVAQTYYVDADHDGYGTTTTAMLCSSTATTGYSVNNLDCNDAKATATLAPVANAGADRTICKGDTITIGTTAVSGTSYYWYTTTRLIGTQVSDPKVYPTTNFKYIVLATSAGGCRKFDTMNVVVKALPTVYAGADITNCLGLQNLLGASIPTSANTTYQWTPTLTQTSLNGKSGKAYPTTTTDYVIKVTNTISGCSNRDTIRINIATFPTIDAGVDRTICNGDTITIGSAAQLGVNYYWYTTTKLIGNRISNPKIYPTSTSKYIVLGVNAGVCRKFDTMNVTVNQLPIANAGIDKSIVTGGSIRIGTTAKSGLQYAWSPTTNLSSSTIANPISSATSTTNYVVKVTATATGCMKNDTMVLMVAPARIRSIVANQPNTIETINSDLNFNIYPNPSNGIANITFAESMAISTIEVVNMQGQLINTIKLEANQSQVQLQQSNTNAGMYLVIAKNIQGEIIAKKTWVVSQ